MLEGLSSLLGKEKVETPLSRPAEPIAASRGDNRLLQR
jgi:hypothetical protein